MKHYNFEYSPFLKKYIFLILNCSKIKITNFVNKKIDEKNLFFILLLFKIIIFCLFFNFLIFQNTSFLSAADTKKTEKELKKIKEDLDKKQEELNKTKKQLTTIKKEVSNLSYNLNLTQKNIKKIEKNIDLQKKDYALYEEKLKAEKLKEKHYRELLKKELQLLYKQKYIDNNDFLETLNVFFTDNGFHKNFEKYKIMEFFLDYNKEKVYITKKQQDIFAKNQEKIALELKSLSQNREKQQKNKLKYNQEQKNKKKQLKTTEENQKLYEQQIKELTETAKKMERLLTSLTKSKKIEIAKYSELVNEFGKISKPASGKIILNFGKNKHDKYDTYYISNGIEIQTNGSVTVESVYEGKVVFCDRFSSYGLTVIIEHPKQVFTVYAYLDSFAVKKDQTVKKGTILGYSGISAVKNVNAVYFEVRLNGIAVDPEYWIK
ncbi:MAG: peptidoglycan DD-metalloendopeptidase family protein [Elusimicrobiota bacterium]|jgi:septal ring factor EnvC (AmiA/AmiB activator)|nr:peptidoglycan DD-metalloendopeptidase family protein [Elusimicrobiota bacterium]